MIMKFNFVNSLRYLTFDIFPKSVINAVFTRRGGLSPEPWNSLNVGGTVGDNADRVRENRFQSFDALGRERTSMFDVWQIHSSDIVVANAPHASSGSRHELKADGILTDNPSVTLFMRFADCTPIMLYDTRNKVIGLVHAGWQGTIKQISGQAIRSMTAVYGSRPSDIVAAIGPSIGPDHYEVGSNVVEQVTYSFGDDAQLVLQERNGRVHLDLWKANRITMERAGVSNIDEASICTACHPEDWYSHRAQKGSTGRFGALMAISRE